MTDTTDQRSPDEIERDIRTTQEEMSRTVQQIEGELTPRKIVDALLDKAGQEGADSRFLIDATRRNPLALGMIAIGGLWLVSDADARPSALKLPMGRSSGKDDHAADNDWHPEHRSYVEHMSRCEPQQGEDEHSYRRHRDHSRASHFMMEQGHDEDEGAFRKRLDDPFEADPGCLPFSLSRRASRPKFNLHHGRGQNSRVAGAGRDLRGPFRRADQ